MTSTETHIAGEVFRDIVEQGRMGNAIAAAAERIANDLSVAQEAINAPVMEQFAAADLAQIATILRETGQQVTSIVGATRTDELEEGRAGYAYQGQTGSSVIDVSAAMHGEVPAGQIVDVHMLADTVAHENEHERQAAVWDAEAVDMGDGHTLNRTQVSEVGAMSVQASIAWVSMEYKETYQYIVHTLGISPEQARETAREGKLRGLAASEGRAALS